MNKAFAYVRLIYSVQVHVFFGSEYREYHAATVVNAKDGQAAFEAVRQAILDCGMDASPDYYGTPAPEPTDVRLHTLSVGETIGSGAYVLIVPEPPPTTEQE